MQHHFVAIVSDKPFEQLDNFLNKRTKQQFFPITSRTMLATASSTARSLLPRRFPVCVISSEAQRNAAVRSIGASCCRPFGTTQNSQRQRRLDMAYGPVNGFQMNQYVLACTETRQAVLIDCGASTQKELDGFLQWMTDRDYTLTAVWQTHAHLDHVAGLGLLAGSTSTAMDVPIYLHEKERTIYNSFDDRCREFGFHVEGGAAAAAALPKDTELTYLNDDSQQLSLGNLTFDIVHTPGHSPGHLGFLCDGMFFGGDFIMKGSIGRTDFPTSNDADMQKSLQRFVQTIPEDTLIFPGHGPPTSLKEEKEINPFLR